MEVGDSRLERSFDYLDDSHRSLVEESTKLFSIAEEHSETDYESSLETRDLYMNDDQVEKRMDRHLEKTREAVQVMDAALIKMDEELENVEEGARTPPNYIEMIEKKRWYKEKYIELTEELSRIEETSLAEKTQDFQHEKPEYEVPNEEFEIEIGHERKAKKAGANNS